MHATILVRFWVQSHVSQWLLNHPLHSLKPPPGSSEDLEHEGLDVHLQHSWTCRWPHVYLCAFGDGFATFKGLFFLPYRTRNDVGLKTEVCYHQWLLVVVLQRLSEMNEYFAVAWCCMYLIFSTGTLQLSGQMIQLGPPPLSAIGISQSLWDSQKIYMYLAMESLRIMHQNC